jgi:hypothetical protein
MMGLRSALLGILLILMADSLPAQAPKPLDPRAAINAAVRDIIEKDSSLQFIKVGSHVSGKKYRSPLSTDGNGKFLKDVSDHDFRMVLTDPDASKDAVTVYKEVRAKLEKNVRAQLSEQLHLSEKETEQVLGSINLYPPESVAKEFQSEKEAAAFFQKIDATPNLAKKNVEGVFGENARTWIHHYEEKAGRLVYMDPKSKKVMEGMTDLLHRQEEDGFAKFTSAGCANLAGQFAEKGKEAAGLMQAKTLFKDLQRMRTALAKSKGLARVPAQTEELDSLILKLENLVGGSQDEAFLKTALKDMGPEIKQVLQKTSTESRILKAMAETTSPVTKAFYRKLLSSPSGAWGKIKTAFWDKLPSAGDLISNNVMAWGLAIQRLYNITTTESDTEKARELAKGVLEALGGSAYFPAELTDMMLEAVAEEGIAAAARAQDCLDLLAGIYSPWGVDYVSDDEKMNLQGGDIPGQLAILFPDTSDGEAALKNLVHRHAVRAGNLHQNPDPAFKHKLAQAIELQCLPQILRARKIARLERIEKINKLMQEVEGAMIGGEAILSLASYPEFRIGAKSSGDPVAQSPVIVEGSFTQSLAKINQNLLEIRSRVRELEGGKGEPVSFDWQFQTQFSGPSGNKAQTAKDSFNYLASPPLADALKHTFRLGGLGSYSVQWDGQLVLTTLVLSSDLWSDLSALPQPSRKYKLQSQLEFEVEEDGAAPALTISPAQLQGFVGQEYLFVASGVALPEKARVVWTFGDTDLRQDSTSVSGGKFTRAHTYAQAGSYQVKAMLIDGSQPGQVLTAATQVVISVKPESAPQTAMRASLFPADGKGLVGYPIKLQIDGSGLPSQCKFVWTWGDGAPDETNANREGSHLYPGAGDFTASIAALDPGSNKVLATQSFKINIMASNGSIEAMRRSLHYSGIK